MAFMRKVYSITTVQLLLTIAVASVAIFVRPVALFFFSSIQGMVLYIVLIFVPFLGFCPLKYYSLLFIFTVNGLDCAFESRMQRDLKSLPFVVIEGLDGYPIIHAQTVPG